MIGRIAQGQFQGADYVLFGSLSDADFRQDVNAIDNTDTYSTVLGLTLVADFSLIDTRTHEVKAAFTAMGEAQDVKLVKGGDRRVTPTAGAWCARCRRPWAKTSPGSCRSSSAWARRQ